MKRGSLVCAIPKKLREEMADDPFYAKCCLKHKCVGRIQFHHHLNYAGKRQNAKFCILPVCEWIHERVSQPEIKRMLTRIMVARATEQDRLNFPRIKWPKNP